MTSRPLQWTFSLLGATGLVVLLARASAGPEEPPAMKSPGGVRNRLAAASSPYLLLHQDNPVDWYPWGEEALARARREDKPIFLSVGYSTCYWCHVMARESFSDPAIAALLNRDFVAIKVDREERPDLDEVYLTATQLLTGRGGWPNSVFLTPELVPFYAGTYFPPYDRAGQPGFATLLAGLATAWRERRSEVDATAARVAGALAETLAQAAEPSPSVPSAALAERSLELLAERFDAEWGGFGPAPKFPGPSQLLLLLDFAAERPPAAEMLATTLDHMARGGLCDQLAGGFHRYATDQAWRVPHFEKMLYDNGWLLEVYARWSAAGGGVPAARVARATAAFLARELSSPEGALWSAIDAETDGEEGAYYLWHREQVERALGAGDAAFLAPLLGLDGAPGFAGDRHVLHQPRPVTDPQVAGRLEPLRRKLLAVRDQRPRPRTDDKVLADWNGVAIAGLATAGELLADPALVAQGVRAADFVLRELRPSGGPLQHSWREGTARVPAFLSDYVFLVRGLLALHQATGEPRWLRAAEELTAEQVERLGDPRGGFFVAAPAPDLLWRSKDPYDGAQPAANGVAVLNLLELARRSAEPALRQRWQEQAEAALRAFGPRIEDSPAGARTLALAVRRYHQLFPGAPTVPSPPRLASKVEVEAEAVVRLGAATLGAASADGWQPFVLPVEIAPGWHLNAAPASLPWLVATELDAAGAELRQLRYPPAVALAAAWAEGEIRVLRGTVELAGELRRTGAGGRLRLTYQACDDQRCLPPVTRDVELP